MPDLKSSGMPVIYCTGMPKNHFSGRLIELVNCPYSQPNLNTSSSHIDFKPPTPPHPRGALLQICLWLNLTFILDNYFCLSLETIFDDHPRISKGRVKKKWHCQLGGGGHIELWCDTSSKWVCLFPMPHYGRWCRISTLIMAPINFSRNSDLFKD